MEASSASQSLVGTVIAERYRITKLLGEGGMGAVFLAEHMLMRKRVALKLLHADMSGDEEILGRFRREAQAAARIEHPNVAAATDFGQTGDGSFFLVLEYVEGTSLRHVIDEGVLAPARALHIVRQTAIALEKAHEAGIVHRDLKPDNIMLVTKDGDPDFVKVLDFGIAKLEASARDGKQIITRYGTILGTPEYMSPEQAAGDPAGPAADFYSVGVMLYEMLTGKIPFDADERTQILSLHIIAPPPKMSDRAPAVEVPAPIEAFVMNLLEKDAKLRPADAVALRRAVEAAAASAGIELLHVTSARSLTRGSDPVPTPPAPAPPWRSSDALAKTEYGLTSEPDAAASANTGAPNADATVKIRGVATGIPGLHLGPLDTLPRPLAIAALGAPFFVLAFVFVVIASLVSHKPSAQGHIDGGAESAASARPTHATAVQITNAKTGGLPALEALAAEFPEDPAVQVELARAFAAAGRTQAFLVVVKKLEPAAVDDELLKAVVAAAQKPDSAEEAYALLEGSLGGHGVDGLVDLATMKPPRQRAVKALARPDVRGRASPAAALFLDLKAATSCTAKHDLLARAQESGDARALPLLRALKNTRGCGVFGRSDCWSCLRKDDDLDDAVRAVEARTAKP